MSHHIDAQKPLLKDNSRPAYGTTSSVVTSAVEAGQQNGLAPVEAPVGSVKYKQIVASLGILLSAGAKIVHMGLQYWSACNPPRFLAILYAQDSFTD